MLNEGFLECGDGKGACGLEEVFGAECGAVRTDVASENGGKVQDMSENGDGVWR